MCGKTQQEVCSFCFHYGLHWKTLAQLKNYRCVLTCTHTKLKKTQTHTFGFHPKYFSMRLVRFSENYWHLQASRRDREDELKSWFSVDTVFTTSVFHQPQSVGVFDQRRMAQLSAHTWLPCKREELLVVLYLVLHTKKSQGQQHSRDPGFNSLSHKAAFPGFS